MAVQPKRYRFTTADYHRMAEAGILHEDSRVELIEGEIVEMSPIGDRHVGCVNVLTDLLADVVRREALISVQNPIRLSADGEPQPDIALPRRGAPRAVPTPEDVLLVIEVAQSSLRYDRAVKLPLYARHGIPEVWIVNLGEGVVEVYRTPEGEAYRSVLRATKGESLEPGRLPGARIAVAEVLR